MEKGRVILLNGVSSSGKTTIAEALREKLQEPYYLLSGDTLGHMVSPRFFAENRTSIVRQIYKALHHTTRSFSDMDMNCIVDTIFLSMPEIDDCLEDFINQLNGTDVLIVNVHCPLDELKRREKERGDRGIGQAESQLNFLQLKDLNDISVDTFLNTTDECVDKIIEIFYSFPQYSTFATLCKEYPKHTV